ncbi:WD repeat-containing protein 43 [Lamellibrachia satsuma]|nr:WD repeat-containing protein 43 [Lamellibrachia satsuma]
MRITYHVVIMAQVMPVAFSQTGEYFAYSSPDGTLKLWETVTGTLKQEYTPSSHLSATCTCLAWGPSRKSNESPRKKKKRRSSITLKDDCGRVDMLAMGTTSGSLLVYSLLKGDLHTQLTDGHTDLVNDVCWTSNQEYLYSCSNDRHIVQWCLSTSTVKEKWKADKASIFSICLCGSDSHMLVASRSIKLWDLHRKEVVRTFTGHATEVFRMISVRHTLEEAGDSTAQVEGTYFLSAAINDRLINAWQVNTSSRDKSAIASFSLPDEPVYLQLSPPTSSRQAILLLVVTKTGQLVVFEHSLNGRCKKPLKPCVVVQIATEGNNGDVPRQIPVLAASGCGDNVLLVHGHFLKPTFENLPYKSFNSDTCLIRSDPSRTVLHAETSVSKVKTPAISKEATLLCPDYMDPTAPARTQEAVASRNKKRRKSHEMSMEDRLQAMGVDQKGAKSSGVREPPKADTLSGLLSQGLQSHDKKILSNVLQRTNESLIMNTVRGLQVQVIVPLVQELSRRIYGHAHSGHTTLKWLKAVLTLHTSYLMTVSALYLPNLLSLLYLPNLLSPLYLPNLITPLYLPNLITPLYLPNLISPLYLPNLISPLYLPNLISPLYLLNLISPLYLPNLISPLYLPNLISPLYLLNLISPLYLLNLISALYLLNLISPLYLPNLITPLYLPNLLSPLYLHNLLSPLYLP